MRAPGTLARREAVNAFASRWLPPVEETLKRTLSEEVGAHQILMAPAGYWLEIGGKRLRPLAVMAACELVGGSAADALDAACAIELIHTSSLILDDLPCMDDAGERRGARTLHRVFGESSAILAALLLLNLAHRRLSMLPIADGPSAHERVCHLLGGQGMILGQAVDLGLGAGSGLPLDGRADSQLQLLKTTSLMVAGMELGGRLGKAEPEVVAALGRFGLGLGSLLQAVDDQVDGEGPGNDGAGVGQARAAALRLLGDGSWKDSAARRVLGGLVDMLADGRPTPSAQRD